MLKNGHGDIPLSDDAQKKRKGTQGEQIEKMHDAKVSCMKESMLDVVVLLNEGRLKRP